MYDNGLIETAIAKGLLSDRDLAVAERRQTELADRGLERSLWQIVQELGLLAVEHAQLIEQSRSSDQLEALQVDGYVLQGRLGKGGMGDVFLACRQDGREAAVKLLPSNLLHDEEYLGRFQREVEALAMLEHPHITSYIADGTVEGRPYLIMQLNRGSSLKEYLNAGNVCDERLARLLVKQIGGALEYAWQRAGLVHRDVKPANILVEHGAGSLPLHARLCDFGLAKFLSRPDATRRHGVMTHSGVAIGTPHYMSPEQATGDRSVDQRHDIYGLGATVYHALLGKTLYSGGSSAVIMYKQATAVLDMKPLSRLGLSPEFTDLLARMLAKPRERRFSDWTAVREALAALPALAEAGAEGTRRRQRLAPGIDAAARGQSHGRSAPRSPGRGLAGIWPLTFGVIALICLGAGLALGSMSEASTPRVLQATPATFASVLEEAIGRTDSGRAQAVQLAAGTYAGPWRFTAAASGLHLLAEPGAILQASQQMPAIEFDGELRDFHLQGLRITEATTAAIVVGGGEIRLTDCRIENCYQILKQQAGQLVISGLQAQYCGLGLHVQAGASFVLSDSVLEVAQDALVADDASVSLQRTRFTTSAPQSSAALTISGGALSCEAVVITAPRGSIGLRLRGVGLARLQQVAVTGAGIGIDASDSTLPLLEGVQLEVSDIGLRWSGRFAADWRWLGIATSAERPAVGLPGPWPTDVAAPSLLELQAAVPGLGKK